MSTRRDSDWTDPGNGPGQAVADLQGAVEHGSAPGVSIGSGQNGQPGADLDQGPRAVDGSRKRVRASSDGCNQAVIDGGVPEGLSTLEIHSQG